MGDNKDDVGDSLSDILGPELNAQLNKPPASSSPGSQLKPFAAPVLGAPLPPPSPPSANGGSPLGSRAAPLPRPLSPSARPPVVAQPLGAGSLGAPRPPGSPPVVAPLSLPLASGTEAPVSLPAFAPAPAQAAPAPPVVTREVELPPEELNAEVAPPAPAEAALSVAPAAPSPDDGLDIDEDPMPAGLFHKPVLVVVRTFFAELSALGRVALVALLGFLIGGSLWLGASLSPPAVEAPAPWRGYIVQSAPLAHGPKAAFVGEAAMERGEPIEKLEVVSGYALVRDGAGRVGYVPESALGETAPRVSHEAPFARCRRLPGEEDARACEQRGRAQLEACRGGCGTQAGCADACAMLFADCNNACNQVVAPSVSPPVSDQAAVAPEEPAPSEEPRKVKKAKRGKKAKPGAGRKGKKKGLSYSLP